MPPKTETNDQTLPAKDASSFKQLVKLYDEKRYKKALKQADQILKKFPNHGETLALKGLVVYHISDDRHPEAFDLVRAGLKYDVKSHTCWHAYGLLYRQDQNYKEALKCYTMALRLDKENQQIIRDLATLQAQVRDTEGLLATRQQMLLQKSSNRANWISLAVAAQMAGNRDLALKVVDAYLRTVEGLDVAAGEAYEHSELLMYKLQLLEDLGKLEACLDLAASHESSIKDKRALKELRARVLAKKGDKAGAEAAYRTLLSLNTDNYAYHRGLWEALDIPTDEAALTPEQRSTLATLYSDLAAKYPRSDACRRLPLDFLRGAAFEAAATEYMASYVKKGIPSLFTGVKALYRDPSKAAFFGRLFADWADSKGLAASGGLGSGDWLVWVLAFLAGHLDYTGRHVDALAHVDRALSIQSDNLDLHIVRSKVLKHLGDKHGAVEAAEAARKLDLADRFTNTVAVRQLMRAGEVARAWSTSNLFIREEHQPSNMKDLQVSWFEIMCGRAHLASGDVGRALKQFRSVLQHYDDFVNDQYDFHGYCVRKTTLRAYTGMLDLEDRISGHRHYGRAAASAIDCYLRLHRDPARYRVKTAEEEEAAATASMSDAERKKWRQQRKKEEERRQQQEEADKAAKEKEAAKQGKAYRAPKKDDDPEGAQLTRAEKPLEEAAKLAASLRRVGSLWPEAQEAIFEVAIAQGKLLAAAASLQALAALLGRDSHKVAPRTARLAVAAAAAPRGEGAGAAMAAGVLASAVDDLTGRRPAGQYADAWAKEHGAKGVLQYAAGLEARVAAGSLDKAAARSSVVGSKELEAVLASSWHRDAVAALESLVAAGIIESIEVVRAAGAKAFPYSTVFGGSKATTRPVEELGLATNGIIKLAVA